MATTNLNLTTIAGTDNPANFPATYNDAMDKIDAAVKVIKTVSTGAKTLSANGNISYTFSKKAIVLAAYSLTSDTVCMAYPSSGADGDGHTTWWIHCRSASSAGAVATGSITCYLVYIGG